MCSKVSWSERPGAAGATTLVSMPSPRSAAARRSTNEPGASPTSRGYECVKKRTFIRSPILHAFGQPFIELATDVTKLRTLSRDLFAEQSGREKNAAEDQARCDDRPHGSVSDAGKNQHGERDETGQRSDREESSAEHAEEEERLLPEPQLKPDGQHVEHADGNTRQSELRLSGVTWIQRHRNLGHREAFRGGDHDHIPMPVGANRQHVHDLTPIG